jgi:hypothetical protein
MAVAAPIAASTAVQGPCGRPAVAGIFGAMTTWARRRTAGRTARRWPTVEALLAARLRAASKGAGRRAVILGWLGCIGQKVEPRPPALDSPARDRWESARLGELHRQIDVLRILRPRP